MAFPVTKFCKQLKTVSILELVQYRTHITAAPCLASGALNTQSG